MDMAINLEICRKINNAPFQEAADIDTFIKNQNSDGKEKAHYARRANLEE